MSGVSADAARPTVRAPLGWTVLVAAFLLAPLWVVGGDLGTNPLHDHRLCELARGADGVVVADEVGHDGSSPLARGGHFLICNVTRRDSNLRSLRR